MKTHGFYKILDGVLQFAPNYVISPKYELHVSQVKSYKLPIDGWFYFESLEEACIVFKIEIPIEETNITWQEI